MSPAADPIYQAPGERTSGQDYSIELVGLQKLMALTSGTPNVVIGLVDGPVSVGHPDLAGKIRAVAGTSAVCDDMASVACAHGTFVAGILAARRGAQAPAIAPGCTLMVRTIFREDAHESKVPNASPSQLAGAIVDCVDAGARILNLSVAVTGRSFGTERDLQDAVDYSCRRGVLIFAAAGNQGAVASSTIIRHPWVVPIVAYKEDQKLLPLSNIGRSIGLRGLGASGNDVRSLSPTGESTVASGTSVAVPFASGAAALLWSLLPHATAAQVRNAMLESVRSGSRSIIPPLLNAEGAYRILLSMMRKG